MLSHTNRNARLKYFTIRKPIFRLIFFFSFLSSCCLFSIKLSISECDQVNLITWIRHVILYWPWPRPFHSNLMCWSIESENANHHISRAFCSFCKFLLSMTIHKKKNNRNYKFPIIVVDLFLLQCEKKDVWAPEISILFYWKNWCQWEWDYVPRPTSILYRHLVLVYGWIH